MFDLDRKQTCITGANMNRRITRFHSTFHFLAHFCFLLIATSFSSNANSAGMIMIDFTQPDEYQQWQATNDNVMGGISQGQITFDGQSSRFYGELSLANNGGFSSISRPIAPLPVSVEQVAIEFVGDGRAYQLRLATWKNGTRITYKHEFSTTLGLRQRKILDLHNFQAVFRGQLITGAPALAANDIRQVGLLIADKMAGPFELNLVQVQFIPTSQRQ